MEDSESPPAKIKIKDGGRLFEVIYRGPKGGLKSVATYYNRESAQRVCDALNASHDDVRIPPQVGLSQRV